MHCRGGLLLRRCCLRFTRCAAGLTPGPRHIARVGVMLGVWLVVGCQAVEAMQELKFTALQSLQADLGALFDRIDTNGDGVVDKAELAAALAGQGAEALTTVRACAVAALASRGCELCVCRRAVHHVSCVCARLLCVDVHNSARQRIATFGRVCGVNASTVLSKLQGAPGTITRVQFVGAFGMHVKLAQVRRGGARCFACTHTHDSHNSHDTPIVLFAYGTPPYSCSPASTPTTVAL